MRQIQKLLGSPFALVVPGLAVLLIVFGIPLFQLLLESLNAPSFSIINYKTFLSQAANLRVLIQTLEISAVATFICLLIGYPTAYFIVAAPRKVRIALIALVVVPYLTSGLARTYSWIVILGDNGLLNNFLIDIGLIANPLQLLYNRTAVYVGMVHIMLPMMILPLISVMMGIDRSLPAAARSMGARPSTAFWRVFFPLSIPGVRSGTLLVFVICLGFYITPAALGGLGDAMLSTFIASQVATAFSIGSIAASSFVLLAIAIIVLSTVGLDLSGAKAAAPHVNESRSLASRWLAPTVRWCREAAISRRAKGWATQLHRKSGGDKLGRLVSSTFVSLALLFLLFPEIVVVVMSFSDGSYLKFPPSGLSLQWYRSFFGDAAWYGAAWTSVRVGLQVAILATVVGTITAYGLSRIAADFRALLMMAILTPITIPVIVVGVASYLGLVNLGLIGTETGVVLAQTIGAISYVVVIVSATLANFDRRLERAALSMRASPLRTFMRVTLPIIRPGILGGALFAFIHSFDEVVVTSLVSGFVVRTLPLKMWENIRNEIDPTVAAVASLLTLLPIIWLVALYATWWKGRQRAGSGVQNLTTA